MLGNQQSTLYNIGGGMAGRGRPAGSGAELLLVVAVSSLRFRGFKVAVPGWLGVKVTAMFSCVCVRVSVYVRAAVRWLSSNSVRHRVLEVMLTSEEACGWRAVRYRYPDPACPAQPYTCVSPIAEPQSPATPCSSIRPHQCTVI